MRCRVCLAQTSVDVGRKELKEAVEVSRVWSGGQWLDNWDGGSNAVPPQARRKHGEESEGMSGVTYRIKTREILGKGLSDNSNKKRDI